MYWLFLPSQYESNPDFILKVRHLLIIFGRTDARYLPVAESEANSRRSMGCFIFVNVISTRKDVK
jgi:hypothetical protein